MRGAGSPRPGTPTGWPGRDLICRIRAGQPFVLGYAGHPARAALPASAACPGQAGALRTRGALRCGRRYPQGLAQLRAMGGGGAFRRKRPAIADSQRVPARFCHARPPIREVHVQMHRSSMRRIAMAASAWDDPTIGIDWGMGEAQPVLSDKDAVAPASGRFRQPVHLGGLGR